jgi:NADPH:quinone reductase
MRAVILQDYGSTKHMRLQEVSRPDLRPGCVLIQVYASSVNPIDIKLCTLGADMPIASKPPYIPGIDVVGEVMAVADGVTEFKVGDIVYGCPGGLVNRPGTLAEYVVADVNTIALAPENLSIPEIAALPLVGITAWEAVFERITLTQSDTLLVYGGTGGVGHIALQLAASTGAHIVATASDDEKSQLARSLGANGVFNARTTSVQKVKEDYPAFDYVFDTIGGEHLTQSFDVVRSGGEVVTIAARANVDLSLMHAKGLSLHVVFMLAPLVQNDNLNRYNRILTDLTRRVEESTLRPLLDTKTFSLDEADQAYDYLSSGKNTGKVVVLI